MYFVWEVLLASRARGLIHVSAGPCRWTFNEGKGRCPPSLQQSRKPHCNPHHHCEITPWGWASSCGKGLERAEGRREMGWERLGKAAGSTREEACADRFWEVQGVEIEEAGKAFLEVLSRELWHILPNSELLCYFAIWLDIPHHNGIPCGSIAIWGVMIWELRQLVVLLWGFCYAWKVKLGLTWLVYRQGSRFARCMQKFELRQSHPRPKFFRYIANQSKSRVLSKNSLALCSRRRLVSAI